MKICFFSWSSAAAAGGAAFFAVDAPPAFEVDDGLAGAGFVDCARADCAGAKAMSEASSVAMVVVEVMVGVRVIGLERVIGR
jgi:hypothetical protein